MEDSPGPSFKCCSMCMRHCFETHRNFMRSESEALFASPAFFRRISKSHVTGSKFLRIPVLFMEKLNHSIGEKLNLKGPSGFECVVTVKYHDKGYVLQSGFDQFMNYHDLDVGDSLVFTLVADSSFLIKVFDKCGSEKTGSPKCQDNVTDDESVPRSRELTGECRLRSKECLSNNGDVATRNKLQFHMHKGSRSNGDKNEEEDIQSARCSSAQIGELLTKHSAPSPKVTDISPQVFGSPRPTEHLENAPGRSGQKRKQPAKTGKDQKVDCLRNAARPSMDSLNNPYQFCIMTNSHVNTHHYIHLKKLQLPETSSALTLLDSHEQQYTVLWIVSPRSGSRLGAGWKQFVVDHKIEVGDACVFEHNTQYMLTVHIFHLKDYWKPTRVNYQLEQDLGDASPPKESGRSAGETFNFHLEKEEDKTSGKMTTPSVANCQAEPSSTLVANRIKKRPRGVDYNRVMKVLKESESQLTSADKPVPV